MYISRQYTHMHNCFCRCFCASISVVAGDIQAVCEFVCESVSVSQTLMQYLEKYWTYIHQTFSTGAYWKFGTRVNDVKWSFI